MTNLPYGRGSSPQQNLIQRGHISAIFKTLRCGASLNAALVYFKQPLSPRGNAEEIFLTGESLIDHMIERVLRNEPKATPQQGEPVLFSCGGPAQSNLACCPEGDLSDWRDQILLLVSEGYPNPFLEAPSPHCSKARRPSAPPPALLGCR